MDITRTPFPDSQILKFGFVKLVGKIRQTLKVFDTLHVNYVSKHKILRNFMLIQAKSGFHYHMRLGTHEIMVLVVSE